MSVTASKLTLTRSPTCWGCLVERQVSVERLVRGHDHLPAARPERDALHHGLERPGADPDVRCPDGAGFGEHVLVADQPRDRRVDGLPDQRAGVAELSDASIHEHQDPVGEAQRLVGAMGDVHDRRGPVAQRGLEVVEEGSARFRVESGGGLVEQQQPRLERERAREAHPLRLAAGQGERLAVGEAGDLEALERREGGASAARAVEAPPAQWQLHVADHGRGQEPGTLRRVTDPAPEVEVGVVYRHAIDLDAAGGGRLEPGEQPK